MPPFLCQSVMQSLLINGLYLCRYVLNELIETERVYIEDLRQVMQVRQCTTMVLIVVVSIYCILLGIL